MSTNLNPFSAVSWSWRALRGHSVTFAALFALSLLGFSALTAFRHLLVRLGAPWYLWLLAPILLVGYVSRKETQWLPDPAQRRQWARALFFGSIVLAILIARIGAWLRAP